MDNFYTKDLLKKEIEDGITEIGDYTYGNPKILHWGESAKLRVGKFCSIADEVKIFLGGNHRADWITTYPFPALKEEWPEAQDIEGHPATRGDVIIGNDVWIGNGAIILSGVRIGNGAVIGAGAVIRQDVEPYSIVIGNPALEIKKRFKKEKIEKLLELEWWDWPVEKIRENIKTLCSKNLEKIFDI